MGLAQWPWPNHRSMPTLHFLTTLAPFFHVSGFLGLPPVSQGCLSIGGRGILIGKRQPASSKSPSFIASTRNLSLYWGNYTNRLCDLSGSFQCNQFFSIPLISPKSPKDQVIHLWPHSINHQIYFVFHWLEPKQSKNGLCGKRGIWFTQEKTNDDWLMTKKWPHRPAWQIETFLVSCTSARCDKGCQNGAFYGNKNPVQSRRVFPLQKTIQSLSIGIILEPGGTMALSNQESCKSAYYTPDQRGCRRLSGRVLLITSSSWFKLVPVVFVFLLVYYLRKHLSFLKSEWFRGISNFFRLQWEFQWENGQKSFFGNKIC